MWKEEMDYDHLALRWHLTNGISWTYIQGEHEANKGYVKFQDPIMRFHFVGSSLYSFKENQVGTMPTSTPTWYIIIYRGSSVLTPPPQDQEVPDAVGSFRYAFFVARHYSCSGHIYTPRPEVGTNSLSRFLDAVAGHPHNTLASLAMSVSISSPHRTNLLLSAAFRALGLRR